MLQVIWTLLVPEKLSSNNKGAHVLDGEIFIRTQAGDFPSRGWKDQPVVVMQNLIATTLQLANTRNAQKRYFPFGPYYLEIDVPVKDLLTIHFMRSYLPEPLESLPPVTLPFVKYCHILLQSGYTMLEACRSKGIGTRLELAALEKSLVLLNEAVVKQ